MNNIQVLHFLWVIFYLLLIPATIIEFNVWSVTAQVIPALYHIRLGKSFSTSVVKQYFKIYIDLFLMSVFISASIGVMIKNNEYIVFPTSIIILTLSYSKTLMIKVRDYETQHLNNTNKYLVVMMANDFVITLFLLTIIIIDFVKIDFDLLFLLLGSFQIHMITTFLTPYKFVTKVNEFFLETEDLKILYIPMFFCYTFFIPATILYCMRSNSIGGIIAIISPIILLLNKTLSLFEAVKINSPIRQVAPLTYQQVYLSVSPDAIQVAIPMKK